HPLCPCDGGLGESSIDVPQIDLCVSPTPGAAEVCYDAEKRARHDELCAGGGECLRPELTADMGRILAGTTGVLNIKVTNVGNANLTLFNPTGSALGYSLSPAQQPGSNPYKVLVPGEVFSFELRRGGTSCGSRDARILINTDHPATRRSGQRRRAVRATICAAKPRRGVAVHRRARLPTLLCRHPHRQRAYTALVQAARHPRHRELRRGVQLAGSHLPPREHR